MAACMTSLPIRFEPTEVWEVRAADLTLSPVHKAAVGRLHPERGVAVRFPRFVRVRDDKAPTDATTADEVVALYNKQVRKVSDAGALPGGAEPAGSEAGGADDGENKGDCVSDGSHGEAGGDEEEGFWNDVA